MNTPFKFAISTILALLLVSCSSKKKHKEHTKSKTAQKTTAQYVQQASFTALNGKKVSVSDFKGKIVLIDFWATWCKPCVKSLPTLSKLQKKYPNTLKILAVTPGFTDTKKDVQSFVSKHHYDLTYLMDTDSLHTKLHIRGIPYKIFINPKGKFIKKSMGSHGPKRDYQHIKKIVEKYKKQSEGSAKKQS
ncbi:MAG TPA: TlpA disulfide reductase family protein [Balneolaceae bacterium]|nr:TlpA disulfide reductase family protein [Balneolaceae bacterium]